MDYSVEFSPEAIVDLEKLDRIVAQRSEWPCPTGQWRFNNR